MTPKLTKDQEEACDKFMRFLISNDKEFYLFGSAGSGKTFLLKYLTELFTDKYEDYCTLIGIKPKLKNYAFTATTNKAVAVLSEALEEREPVQTVFSYFYIKVVENFITGKTELQVQAYTNVQNTIVFIDECSMLSSRALQIIRDVCDDTCKLVFIGDNNQLAPVNEKPYWNNTPERTTAYLTTLVRSKGAKNLSKLCKQLKTTVQTGKFFPIVPDNNCIIKADDEYAKEFLSNFNSETDIVLAYTNKAVENYSNYIIKHCTNPKLSKGPMVNVDHFVHGYRWGKERQDGTSFHPEQRVILDQVLRTVEGRVHCQLPYTITEAWIKRLPNKECYVVSLMDYAAKQKLLNTLWKCSEWEDYYYIKNGTMTLRTSYATTVHKSQGSTYDRVFIDLDSFNACRDKETLTRLLYVAVSRARKQVIFYGSINLEKWHHAS